MGGWRAVANDHTIALAEELGSIEVLRNLEPLGQHVKTLDAVKREQFQLAALNHPLHALSYPAPAQ